MSKIENKDFTVDLQLKSIELLKGSISLPSVPDVSLTNFNFNISLESKADATNKFLFVIVSVEIRSEDQNHILGSLAVSCIYSIINFDEVVKIEADGKLDIPKQLVEILNSITISTARGVMFSTFKGTFLHNAFLPIIDPSTFQQVEQQK
jgi:hypothetical protein